MELNCGPATTDPPHRNCTAGKRTAANFRPPAPTSRNARPVSWTDRWGRALLPLGFEAVLAKKHLGHLSNPVLVERVKRMNNGVRNRSFPPPN